MIVCQSFHYCDVLDFLPLYNVFCWFIACITPNIRPYLTVISLLHFLIFVLQRGHFVSHFTIGMSLICLKQYIKQSVYNDCGHII